MTALIEFLGIRGLIGLGATIVLSVLLGLQVHKTRQARADATAWTLKYDGEHAAFQQTLLNYAQAAATARAADAANSARVRAEQAAINQRTTNEYEARLADARAHAQRLRQQLASAAAHQGRPAAAPVSGPHAASSSPAGPAAEDGFSLSDRLTATEQAIQLDELIKWVRANVRVDYRGK